MKKNKPFGELFYRSLRKTLLIMRIAIILLILGVLQTHANDAYSQRTRLSVNFSDAVLTEVLDKIEMESEFYFLYNEKFLDTDRKVSIKADEQLITTILDNLFAGTHITYTIIDRKIILVPDYMMTELQQKLPVTGKVTDAATGTPMPGVNIVIKGTTIGTMTDAAGSFSLTVTDRNVTLVFSFIGYITQEIQLNDRTTIDVALAGELTGLDEVVVIGYGTQKRISVTGAIVSVQTDNLISNPSATVSSSLAGRVTGLTSVQYSGQPGYDEPIIYIRGLGSLTSDASQPLILVDGVERPFSQLDPNEIESVSILKDASATAVYGIRGANGVIIVTTKRGYIGAPKITISSSAGAQFPTRLTEMTDSYLYGTLHNAATLDDNPSAVPVFSAAAIKAFKEGGTLIYPNTDWINYLVKPAAFQTQHSFNISGGTGNIKYFVNLGYFSQDGLFETFDVDYAYQYGFKRYNYRTNLDLNITSTTNISLTIGGRSEIRQQPGSIPSDGPWVNLFWAVPYSGMVYEGKRIYNGNNRLYIPTTEKKDGLTAIGWGSGYRRETSNPMNIDFGLTQNLEAIAKGLSWRFKFANNSSNVQYKLRSTSKATYEPYYLCDVTTAVGDSTIVFKKNGSDGLLGYAESSSKARNWYMETALSYDRNFGSHNVTGLLLYNQSKTFYPTSYSDIPLGYVGIAARLTYNYQSKYMVDLNLGYNGSENFAPGNRFGFFPAFSAGWAITEENFLKDRFLWLSYLKIRASVGTVGNDKMGTNRFLYLPDSYYSDLNSYSFGSSNPTNVKEAHEGFIGNPDVTWERAVKQNYGFDLRMFSGNLSLSMDFFYEFRNNILTRRNTVPSILAIPMPAQNIGEVENKGYEAELKWRDGIKNFNYYFTANMSFARNKVIYKDEVPKNEPWLYETGQRINQPFGYVFEGFWTQEQAASYQEYPDQSYVPKAGDVRYKDLNNDGVINTDDKRPIGFPDYPEYIASIQSGFDFKGFDISMLWTGVTNVSRSLNFAFGDNWSMAFGELGDRGLIKWQADNHWTPETAETAITPRITFTGRINNTLVSDLWTRDASYIRLKNLELGYSIQPTVLKRFGISTLRFYVNGYNLLLFDKMKFMDPESSRNYPIIRIMNFGLNLNF